MGYLPLYRPPINDSGPPCNSTFCLCIFSSSSNNSIVDATIQSNAAPSRIHIDSLYSRNLPNNRDQSRFQILGSLLDSLHHLQLTRHLKQWTLHHPVNDSVVKLGQAS